MDQEDFQIVNLPSIILCPGAENSLHPLFHCVIGWYCSTPVRRHSLCSSGPFFVSLNAGPGLPFCGNGRRISYLAIDGCLYGTYFRPVPVEEAVEQEAIMVAMRGPALPRRWR